MATTTSLRAFHGDPAIKARYVERLEQHRKRGQIVRGDYLRMRGNLEDNTFVGNVVGCTVHSDLPATYEEELEIPSLLAWLEEGLFDGVPAATASQFAVDFLVAVPVGADLSLVAPQFFHWVLMDAEDGVVRYTNTSKVKASLQGVAYLLSQLISGETVTAQQWQVAGDTARVAAVVTEAIADEAVHSKTGNVARRVSDRYSYLASAHAAHAASAAAHAIQNTAKHADAAAHYVVSYAANASRSDAHSAAALHAPDATAYPDASDAAYHAAVHTAKAASAALCAKQATKLLRLLREAPASK